MGHPRDHVAADQWRFDELDQASGQRGGRVSRDQITALVRGLGDMLAVLANPDDKAEVSARLVLASPMTLVGASCPSSRASTTRGESPCRRGDFYRKPMSGHAGGVSSGDVKLLGFPAMPAESRSCPGVPGATV